MSQHAINAIMGLILSLFASLYGMDWPSGLFFGIGWSASCLWVAERKNRERGK